MLVRRLILVVAVMFCFGFLLSPLYDVFCRVTGINGKVTRTGPLDEVVEVNTARRVKVQLIAVNNEGMAWHFKPEVRLLEVYPGEQRLTYFVAHNPTSHSMSARAVPSVAPSEAAQYFHKINCFCFESQTLADQATQRMPLVFMIDPQLPDYIETVTLSYTLFDISAQHERVVVRREI